MFYVLSFREKLGDLRRTCSIKEEFKSVIVLMISTGDGKNLC